MTRRTIILIMVINLSFEIIRKLIGLVIWVNDDERILLLRHCKFCWSTLKLLIQIHHVYGYICVNKLLKQMQFVFHLSRLVFRPQLEINLVRLTILVKMCLVMNWASSPGKIKTCILNEVPCHRRSDTHLGFCALRLVSLIKVWHEIMHCEEVVWTRLPHPLFFLFLIKIHQIRLNFKK